jgi:hypothetical protein
MRRQTRRWAMLVELPVMEQRHRAVLLVAQGGWKEPEVPSASAARGRRIGLVRQDSCFVEKDERDG